MVRDPMQDILDAAGELFRTSFRQVDIEQFFSDRSIPLADGESKRSYARNTLAGLLREQALELILEVAIEKGDFRLQDAIFELQDQDRPLITEITRRRIAELLGFDLHGAGPRPNLLTGLFELASIENLLLGPSKMELLQKHAVAPSPDWSATEVFALIGAMECPTRRFCSLLETALDPRVRDAEAQEELARQLDPIIRIDGYEVIQVREVSARKVYAIREIQRGVEGRPKNIIFASKGMKPRLGFSDAIDNDVIVLEHAESCLVYDRPIGDGLLWLDLVRWWGEARGIPDEAEARRSHGSRLKESLGSQPERDFFAAYFRTFSSSLGGRLPALIPQVYLHYDPEIIRNLADRTALFRQRMDFLIPCRVDSGSSSRSTESITTPMASGRPPPIRRDGFGRQGSQASRLRGVSLRRLRVRRGDRARPEKGGRRARGKLLRAAIPGAPDLMIRRCADRQSRSSARVSPTPHASRTGTHGKARAVVAALTAPESLGAAEAGDMKRWIRV